MPWSGNGAVGNTAVFNGGFDGFGGFGGFDGYDGYDGPDGFDGYDGSGDFGGCDGGLVGFKPKAKKRQLQMAIQGATKNHARMVDDAMNQKWR